MVGLRAALAALCALASRAQAPHPPRDRVSGTHGQMYSPPRGWKTVDGVTTRSGGGRIDIEALLQTLTETNTNSFGLDLEVADDYLDLVLFLNRTQSTAIGGRQLRVWVVLHSPSHSCRKGSCFNCSHRCTQSIPADSPLTPFDDTEGYNRTLCPILFNASAVGSETQRLHFGCFDYPAWGRTLGRLGRQFPEQSTVLSGAARALEGLAGLLAQPARGSSSPHSRRGDFRSRAGTLRPGALSTRDAGVVAPAS